jgi:hypothetical protein
MARSDLELGYKLLEESILSGQVTSRQLAQMMRGDPKFATWLGARRAGGYPRYSGRLPARPTQTTNAPMMAEDISLIALAAWLHRASKRAESEGDPIEAARLGQACEVVKHAADRERKDHNVPTSRPLAANEE